MNIHMKLTSGWRKYHTIWVMTLIILITIGLIKVTAKVSNTVTIIPTKTAPYKGMNLNATHANTPTPTSTPVLSLIPSKLPTYKQVQSLSKKLLYLYKDNVYASDYNGSNAFKLIDLDEAKLVGWNNKTIYYYAHINKEQDALIKKDLESQKLTTLFTFNTGFNNGQFYAGSASVAKNEKYVVYFDKTTTVYVYDVEKNTHSILLQNKTCNIPKGKFNYLDYCYGYQYPYWAGDDKTVIASKSYYEGGWYIAINPFTESKEIEFKIASQEAEITLSKDSHFFPGPGYGRDSLYAVNDLKKTIAIDVLKLIEGKGYHDINGFAQFPDGILAVIDSTSNPTLNIVDVTAKKITPVVNMNISDVMLISLPDNRTALYKDVNNRIWSIDICSKAKTPFNIKADTIYGYVE